MGELVNEHVHCGIYIVPVETNVNFVPFVHIVPDRPFIHAPTVNSGQDGPTRPKNFESFVDCVRLLKMFDEQIVSSFEFREHSMFLKECYDDCKYYGQDKQDNHTY